MLFLFVYFSSRLTKRSSKGEAEFFCKLSVKIINDNDRQIFHEMISIMKR